MDRQGARHITLRLPAPLVEAVKLLADRHKRTAVAEVEWALEHYVEQEDPQLARLVLKDGQRAAGSASASETSIPLERLLQERLPGGPMTARQLLDFWWPPGRSEKDRRRPKSAIALGRWLHLQAAASNWKISRQREPISNVTLWSFDRQEGGGE